MDGLLGENYGIKLAEAVQFVEELVVKNHAIKSAIHGGISLRKSCD